MSINTSNIDIKAVIERYSCIDWKVKTRTHGELEYHGGPCPFCGQGVDRFAIWPDADKPHFYCGIHGTGCKASGDVIEFVKLVKHCDTKEALYELRTLGYEFGDTDSYQYKPQREKGMPHDKWQEMGKGFVHRAQSYLWSKNGETIREYLHGRGFSDETIKRFRIGYCPDWYKFGLEEWGLTNSIARSVEDRSLVYIERESPDFWVRSGIIIPWFEGDTLWKINLRITRYTHQELELQQRGKKLPRYKAILGSGPGLFNVDTLKMDKPVFLTEGEFDSMIGTQETDFAFVATGSTKGAQSTRWVMNIATASPILLSFDDDDGKGEEAAQYWIDLYEDRSLLWLPWAKDVNAMFIEGISIQEWAETGINLSSALVEDGIEAVSSPLVDGTPKQSTPPTSLVAQQEESATFPEPSLVQVAAPPLHDSTKVTMVTAQEKPSSLPSPIETEPSDIRAQVLNFARQAGYPLHNIHHTVEARGQVEYEKAIAQCPESYLPRLLAKLQKDIESLPPTPVAMPVETQPVTPEENRVVNALAQLFDAKVEIRPLVDGNPTQPWTPKEVQAHTKLEKSNLYCSQCWDAYSAQSIYKRATQHDANDVGYCEKCWQERQFHSSILLAYGKKYDWPFLRTLTTTVEGQTAYELFTLTAKPLDIMEAASTARRLDVFVVPDIVETYVPKKKKEKFENIDIAPNSGDTLDCLVHDIKQLWTAMPQHYENRKKYCHTEMQLWIENGIWTLVTLRECKKRVQDALKTKDIETLQKTRFAMRDILESVCHGHKW